MESSQPKFTYETVRKEMPFILGDHVSVYFGNKLVLEGRFLKQSNGLIRIAILNKPDIVEVMAAQCRPKTLLVLTTIRFFSYYASKFLLGTK